MPISRPRTQFYLIAAAVLALTPWAWAQEGTASVGGPGVVALIMRWLHVLAAIVAVGGAIFMRWVLIPSAKSTLDDATHQNLRAEVIGRWKRFVHTAILLFLVSGFYNYLEVTRHAHDGQAIYHMLFGIKFLLALAVFALAIGLTSSKGWAAGMRARSPFFLSILIALSVAVVFIAGYMKLIPPA